MQEYFDDEEQEPVPQRRDTELTLGPVMLVGLFLGLALLCGASFGVGYMTGHRSVPVAADTTPAATGRCQCSSHRPD